MEKINIVYCTDENFVPVCITSIESVLANRHIDDYLCIHIIQNDISDASRQLIKRNIYKYENAQVEFWDFPSLDHIFECDLKYDSNHISISAFGRLFISSILPLPTRIVYLDCDTIILDSLKDLYEFDLKESVIGAVDDCKSVKYRKAIGVSDWGYYINSGVLVIDLKKWKEYQCESQIVKFIEKRNGNVQFEDQGALNGALNKYITLLPLKYNVMSHLYDMSYEELKYFRNPVIQYTKKEIETAKRYPVIIHYTTSFLTYGRAWYINCDHKMKYMYDKYSFLAGVSDLQKVYKGAGKKKIYHIVQKIFPRKIVIIMGRFMHEAIHPYKYIKNEKELRN